MRREANERSAREAAAAVAELERQQEQVGDARARTGEAGGERPLDCAQERQIRRYFSVQMGKVGEHPVCVCVCVCVCRGMLMLAVEGRGAHVRRASAALESQ